MYKVPSRHFQGCRCVRRARIIGVELLGLINIRVRFRWLGSRVVSVLDSDAEGPGFKSQPRRCRVSLRQIVHTRRASVHQSAKFVAALLGVARVTAGLVESIVSLPPGL